ncbi:hypothetical protein ACHAWF_002752 [Thalassiosira exigua]
MAAPTVATSLLLLLLLRLAASPVAAFASTTPPPSPLRDRLARRPPSSSSASSSSAIVDDPHLLDPPRVDPPPPPPPPPTAPLPLPPVPPAVAEMAWVERTSDPSVAIVIDAENVRGKTSFELDHADLLDRVLSWTRARGRAQGRTIVVVDHGAEGSAHLLSHSTHSQGRGGDGEGGTAKEEEGGEEVEREEEVEEEEEAAMCVTFSGPNRKADDVVARDVGWLASETDARRIVVITADRELAWRCRRAVRPPSCDPSSDRRRKGGPSGRKGKKSRAARKRLLALEREEEEGGGGAEGSEGEEGGAAIPTTDGASATKPVVVDADSAPTVEVVAPQRFLEDLEHVLLEHLRRRPGFDRPEPIADASSTPPVEGLPAPVANVRSLFRLRGRVLSLESSLCKKCSPRKRGSLTEELREAKAEWRELSSSLAEEEDGEATSGRDVAASLATSLSSAAPPSGGAGGEAEAAPSTAWDRLPPREREELLLRWGRREGGGRRTRRRERTEDRIVLAERLRRQLELTAGRGAGEGTADGSLARLYAARVESLGDG